jgi:hypothetical protein
VEAIMLHRYLVLAFAASLATVPPVHAEDAVVPDEFEQQQEAVGGCDAYGAGFSRLPGTNTCIRAGGHIRFERRYSGRSSGFDGRAALDFETHGD